MSSDKYVYNPHTLRFEKVKVSFKQRLVRFFGLASASLVSALLLAYIIHEYFPSPKEKLLMNEIENMKVHYSSLTDQIDLLGKVLGNIQERDANVHRTLLGIDPIDEAVWNGGVGGHQQYEEFQQYENTGEMLISTQKKVDKLERQLYIETKSLDTISTLVEKNEDRLRSIPSIKPVREDKLKRNVQLLSGFGMRIHPIYKIKKMHYGIDFTAPKGTAIQATGDGKIVEVINGGRGFGKHVVIDHGFGFETLYGHMSRIDVKVGQKVVKGQQIGLVGSTGTSTAPHCHYEVHYKGGKVNPIDYVMDGLTPQEYQELVRKASIANQALDY
ncbi:MAG: M23 family metallopeptidase [Saprospiraceae bacterium]